MESAAFTVGLATLASDLTTRFAAPLRFNPEDQLKAPLLTLLTGVAALQMTEADTDGRIS